MGAFEEDALGVSIDAAVEAMFDLDEHCQPYQEAGSRNEQWIHSYVSCRSNDYARERHGHPTDIYVTLEARTGWMGGHTGAALRRGRKLLGDAQRFDLAVWNPEGSLVGIVEIKNAPAMDGARFGDDATKIDRALRSWGPAVGGSLGWGIYLFSCRLSDDARGGDHCGKLQAGFARRMDQIEYALMRPVRARHFRVVDESNAATCMGWGAALIEP